MANRSLNRESLPEPRHPFARWGAGLSVSFWALGVQSFPEPWNKFGALVSAGLGYVVGQALDHTLIYFSKRRVKREQQNTVNENKDRIDRLINERQEVVAYGADPDLIASIDATILHIRKINVDLIATPSLVRKKR
jgi:hypothetical protein